MFLDPPDQPYTVSTISCYTTDNVLAEEPPQVRDERSPSYHSHSLIHSEVERLTMSLASRL